MPPDAADAVDHGLKLLLLLHGVAAIVTAGASVHAGLLGLAALSRGRPTRPRLQRTYAAVLAVAYPLTFALGLLVYPPFVVDVRAAHLDAAMPWATGLFEAKEHLLALGLLAVAYHAARARSFPFKASAPPADHGLFHGSAVLLMVSVVFSALVGLYLTSLRAVGG